MVLLLSHCSIIRLLKTNKNYILESIKRRKRFKYIGYFGRNKLVEFIKRRRGITDSRDTGAPRIDIEPQLVYLTEFIISVDKDIETDKNENDEKTSILFIRYTTHSPEI